MNLAAFDISAIENVPLLEARLELVPRRGEVEAEAQQAHAASRLDVVPQHSLQSRPPRMNARSVAGLVVAALALHVGFAVLFAHLLDWRVVEQRVEREIPVEVVARMPGQAKPPGTTMPNPLPSGTGAGSPLDHPPPRQPKPATSPPPPPLVAAPPDPTRAATQSEQNQPARVAPDAPKPLQPDVTPPPDQAPEALAVPQGDFSIDQAARSKPDPAPQPKPARVVPKPKAPADLAAALPMDFSGLPTSFRAVLSGSGSQASEDYKGLVFGRLGRSQGATERARAQHLRGQVIVAFTVDDAGRISDLKIARSSGVPALDAVALEMIKEAAPFPPPPPGTTRTFTPALSFGDP